MPDSLESRFAAAQATLMAVQNDLRRLERDIDRQGEALDRTAREFAPAVQLVHDVQQAQAYLAKRFDDFQADQKDWQKEVRGMYADHDAKIDSWNESSATRSSAMRRAMIVGLLGLTGVIVTAGSTLLAQLLGHG